VHPRRVLHGPAAPDWRGEIRVGRTSTLKQRSRVAFDCRSSPCQSLVQAAVPARDCSTVSHWDTLILSYLILSYLPNDGKFDGEVVTAVFTPTNVSFAEPWPSAGGRSGCRLLAARMDSPRMSHDRFMDSSAVGPRTRKATQQDAVESAVSHSRTALHCAGQHSSPDLHVAKSSGPRRIHPTTHPQGRRGE
jgi:hypothetical protein